MFKMQLCGVKFDQWDYGVGGANQHNTTELETTRQMKCLIAGWIEYSATVEVRTVTNTMSWPGVTCETSER